MFSDAGFGVILTCAEMRDNEQPEAARCSPEQLMDQVNTPLHPFSTSSAPASWTRWGAFVPSTPPLHPLYTPILHF
eukprot:803933-Prorocentrum_minimum.AAC.1